MDAQPRLEATGALCALVQALARLELEEGYAPRELVHAQEALAENRFLAARDGVAAALIDPVRAVRRQEARAAERGAQGWCPTSPGASTPPVADQRHRSAIRPLAAADITAVARA